MRESQGGDDAYFWTMVRRGWVSMRRAVLGKPEPFERKPRSDEIARELENWSAGKDTKPLY